jgi:aspartate racemase
VKTLGILGGLGPEATAFFYKKVVNFTPVRRDQDHIPTIIFSNTQIPDRVTSITKGNTSAVIDFLQKTARTIEVAGADVLVIPCNTAHYFTTDVLMSITIPFINMIEETGKTITSDKTIKSVGIMATDCTVSTRLFHSVLESKGVSVIALTPELQKIVMDCITAVKAGDVTLSRRQTLDPVIAFLKNHGADRIILGCTEIPLVMDLDPIDCAIDPMDILAKRAIQHCLH